MKGGKNRIFMDIMVVFFMNKVSALFIVLSFEENYEQCFFYEILILIKTKKK
jgi:hypothetical protein